MAFFEVRVHRDWSKVLSQLLTRPGDGECDRPFISPHSRNARQFFQLGYSLSDKRPKVREFCLNRTLTLGEEPIRDDAQLAFTLGNRAQQSRRVTGSRNGRG